MRRQHARISAADAFDPPGETVHLAAAVHHDKIPPVATGENPSRFAEGRSEGLATIRALPDFSDLGLRRFGADAGALGLLHLGMARRPLGPLPPIPFGMRALHARNPAG